MEQVSGKIAGAQLVCWRYELTAADVDDGEDMRYTTYGVRALDLDGKIAASFIDVSTNKAFVQDIVEKCNKFDAHIMHLEDILIDHIG